MRIGSATARRGRPGASSARGGAATERSEGGTARGRIRLDRGPASDAAALKADGRLGMHQRKFVSAALACAAVLAVAAAAPAITIAQAQQKSAAPPPPPAAKPKPYKPLPVTLPAPVNDPSFDAFRKDVATVAQKKDRAALAKMVVAKGFFWEREDGKPLPKKSGTDILAQALNLGAKDGSGWDALAGFAAEPTAAPLPERKEVLCAPATPTF